MNGLRAAVPSAREPSSPELVALELPAGEPFDSVCRLISAALGCRLDLPVDRINALRLAVQTTLSAATPGSTLRVVLVPTAEDLRVEIGPFACSDAERRSIERLVSPLVDELMTDEFGRDVWIALRVSRYPLAAAS